MRLYHFLSAEHALDDVKKKRIKISLIPDLNDPFEINAIKLTTASQRGLWRGFVRDLGRKFGVVCMSKKWGNPLLWSHYADKHYGLCLGFDLLDSSLIQNIDYRRSKLNFILDLNHRTGGIGDETMLQILRTKFLDWKYEDEVRLMASLEEPEPNPKDSNKQLYFTNFNDGKLRLRKIIVGVRSKVTKNELECALADYPYKVEIIKARLAFNSFRVVRNKRGYISYKAL